MWIRLMKIDKLKESFGKRVKDVITGPALEKIKSAINEQVLPKVRQQMDELMKDFIAKSKDAVNELMLSAMKETIKEKTMPKFNNEILDIFTNTASDAVLDAVLPDMMERAKRELINEKLMNRIVSEFLKRF